jgi:hypothetical protein
VGCIQIQPGNIGLYLNTARCSSIVPGYRPWIDNPLNLHALQPLRLTFLTLFHTNVLKIYFKLQAITFALPLQAITFALPNSSSAISRTSRHSLLVVLVVAKDVCITPTWSNAFDISTFVLYARSLILL